MIKQTLTYHYRIRDNSTQLCDALLNKAGSVNFVWNFCNQTQQFALKHKKKWPSAFDLNKLTTGSAKTLKLHSQTVQAICEQYAQSRQQHKKASLRFRTSKHNKSLPWIPFKKSGIQFDKNTGWVHYQGIKFRRYYHRPLPETAQIVTGSICRDSQGHWYLNVTFNLMIDPITYYSQAGSASKECGIDFGLNPALTLVSQDYMTGQETVTEIEPPRFFKKSQDKLAMAQRANKKAQVRKCHAKIRNQRKDWAHKLSAQIVKDHSLIVMGDLNIQKLMKTQLKGHSKAYADLGLGQLKTLITYKAMRQYQRVVEVSEGKLKSTQLCSVCKKYTGPRGLEGLEISQWTCSACKTVHSRNGNSAKNHLQAGQALDRLGYTDICFT